MDDSFNKENVCISLRPHPSNLPIPRPLSPKKSHNSLIMQSSPLKKRPDTTTSASFNPHTIGDHTKFERQHADLLLKHNRIATEYAELELELHSKELTIQEQKLRLVALEDHLKNTHLDYERNKSLLTNEICIYKDLIDDLQVKIKKLTSEVKVYKDLAKDEGSLQNEQNENENELKDILEISEKFTKLLKEFKVLQSNFELERNSKLVLIDQIELLTKENELLATQSKRASELDSESDASVAAHNFTTTIHTMNELTDEADTSNDNEIIEFHPDHHQDTSDDSHILSYFADDLENNHSSPIKATYHDNSIEYTSNFEFPPSVSKRNSILPNLDDSELPLVPELVAKKRASLPAKLKSPKLDDEFVLSPLKLAHNNGFFDTDDSTKAGSALTVHRYSKSKPGHSRYNSHDIVPIRVEFEPYDLTIRSTSVPEKEHHSRIDMINEEAGEAKQQHHVKASARNSAFYALNGYEDTTTTSSKRSSLLLEHPVTDMTRQEIMKLKFELQSLKLHNEKLLSYIGFELQKQKKNIRKLSKKQSARTLKALSSVSKQIEYSDAKLIEQSKDELIHKKRVLRSVSINPILSKRYLSPQVGILSGMFPPFENELGEDEYGFMNHFDTHSKRIFSNGLNVYLNYDEIDDKEWDDSIEYDNNDHHVKKYRSQVFRASKHLTSDDEADDYDDDKADTEEIYDELVNEADISSDSISSEEEIGIINRLKHLVVGASRTASSSSRRKKKEQQQLVDDGLKLKFLTITLGIMIIGLKLSHQHQQT